ncbi:hypothetical protein DENSPDRAFT_845392, partial [Dentipellis sp. KUC8613]
ARMFSSGTSLNPIRDARNTRGRIISTSTGTLHDVEQNRSSAQHSVRVGRWFARTTHAIALPPSAPAPSRKPTSVLDVAGPPACDPPSQFVHCRILITASSKVHSLPTKVSASPSPRLDLRYVSAA